jgi:hypothetical protein
LTERQNSTFALTLSRTFRSLPPPPPKPLQNSLSRGRMLAQMSGSTLPRNSPAVFSRSRLFVFVSFCKSVFEKCSGAGVPPASGASRPCIFAGETPADRRPEARATIFQTSSKTAFVPSNAINSQPFRRHQLSTINSQLSTFPLPRQTNREVPKPRTRLKTSCSDPAMTPRRRVGGGRRHILELANRVAQR